MSACVMMRLARTCGMHACKQARGCEEGMHVHLPVPEFLNRQTSNLSCLAVLYLSDQDRPSQNHTSSYLGQVAQADEVTNLDLVRARLEHLSQTGATQSVRGGCNAQHEARL